MQFRTIEETNITQIDTSSFTCITVPTQLIEVEGTILCPLILIASAPAFFSSFTTARKSPSCTKSFAELIKDDVLSRNVIVIPSPSTNLYKWGFNKRKSIF